MPEFVLNKFCIVEKSNMFMFVFALFEVLDKPTPLSKSSNVVEGVEVVC